MLDPVEFGKAMASIVNDKVAPLLKRIEELEARQPERGEDGADGKDGLSVSIDDVAPMIAAEVAKAVSAIPVPENGKDGRDGTDGKDAEPLDSNEVVSELIARLLVSEGLEILTDLKATEAVAKHFEANPVRDGRDGDQGPKGDAGEKGDPGRDGLDVKDLFRADGGRLLAVMSDGTTKDLGTYVGKDGENGKDGRDGLGFDDCDVEVSEGVVTLKFIRGDMVKTVRYPVPTFDHIGFWADGRSAKAGDHTTHDGCLWRAVRDTSETPSYQSKDWQLAARKGADGQRGKDGKDYRPSEPVKLKGGNDA